MKEIRNNLWNGKDASFVRCVNLDTLDYVDIPIARGDMFDTNTEICKMAHHLKGDNGIISGEYIEYHFWVRVYVRDGSIEKEFNKEHKTYGGVLDSEYKGFWFDLDTFKIKGVCDILYGSYDYDKKESRVDLPDKKKSDAFIKEFNSKIDAVSRV